MAEEYPGGDFLPGDYPEGPEPIRTYGQRYKWDGNHFIRMEQEALKVGATGPTGAIGATGPTGPAYQPGVILMYAGSTLPGATDEWLFCHGQTLNSVTNPQYAALFNAIGTTYGGTGASNFQLPSLTARFPSGAASANADPQVIESSPARTNNPNVYTGTTNSAQNSANLQGDHATFLSNVNEASGVNVNISGTTYPAPNNTDMTHVHNLGYGRHDGHNLSVAANGANASFSGGLVNFVGVADSGHGHGGNIYYNYGGGSTSNAGVTHTHALGLSNASFVGAYGGLHSHVWQPPLSTVFYIIKT